MGGVWTQADWRSGPQHMDSESTFLISSAGVWTLRLRKEGLTPSHLSHVTLITSLNQSGLLKGAPIDLLG